MPEDTKILVVVRNPLDMAWSLFKRDGQSLHTSYVQWFNHTRRALSFARECPSEVVLYERFFSNRMQMINRILSLLPEEGPMKLIADEGQLIPEFDMIIDPFLRHNRATISLDEARVLPSYVKDLYKEILRVHECR